MIIRIGIDNMMNIVWHNIEIHSIISKFDAYMMDISGSSHENTSTSWNIAYTYNIEDSGEWIEVEMKK